MSSKPRAGTLRFLHYSDTGNIGDLLCSPRHYFDFVCARDTLIAGGGASNNFFSGRARRHSSGVRIAWGIGQSWAFGITPSSLDHFLKAALRRITYAKASTRDPGLASDRLPLVPCVSVFHPVTELSVGNETGIFLNSSAPVSGELDRSQSAFVSKFGRPAFVATNALSASDFIDAFSRTGTIITNSYHAAYWGLLSGRSVHILGYSTKFTNLASLFGFKETAVIKFGRGDSEALGRAINECTERAPLQLTNPELIRSRFRTLNLDFARDLEAVGVFATLKHATTNESETILSPCHRVITARSGKREPAQVYSSAA